MQWTWKVAVIGAAALAAVQLPAIAIHTSGNAVPGTRVGYSRIVISGAPLSAVTHTTSPDATIITGSDVALVGNHHNATVQEQFGSGTPVTCQEISHNGTVSHFSCTGLNQSALVSSTLTITVT
jgi:hypothetical protein